MPEAGSSCRLSGTKVAANKDKEGIGGNSMGKKLAGDQIASFLHNGGHLIYDELLAWPSAPSDPFCCIIYAYF